VTLRNMAHSAFWLLPTLLGVAGIFLTLGSDFLAAVQVILYAGAILVLLVFALMLTHGLTLPSIRSHNRQKAIAALVAAALLAVLARAFLLQSWEVTLVSLPANSTAALGRALVDPNRYLLQFEVASVLLLAAIIGAVVVCRRPREN
jgi:NADH-quinone oxidoreductase subunit J